MKTEDKILERVRLLLTRAEHSGTPPAEAELCYMQANKLMVKHAIDEALVRASQSESERRRPVSADLVYSDSSLSEFWTYLRTMLEEIARTNRCRAVEVYTRGDDKVSYKIVGFAEDVSWVEMLYTSCYFTFLSRLRPRWDAAIGYDANVYNFKVAGYKWYDINLVAIENNFPDASVQESVYKGYDYANQKAIMEMVPGKKIKGSMITAYKRHARQIGDENPVATQDFQTYRLSYAVGFSRQIAARLEQMREDAKQAVASSGAELVLVSMQSDVDEMFYSLFPSQRPYTREQLDTMRQSQREAQERERQAREDMLARMTPAQRKKFLEDEEKAERKAARENERYWRDVDRRTKSADPSAMARGRSAADTVSLTRSTDVAGSNTKGIGR